MNKTLAPKGALKRLNTQASPRDRGTGPLQAFPRPPSRYNYYADTLDDLRAKLGPLYGPAAERRVKLSAVRTWAWRDQPELPVSASVAMEAAQLCRAAIFVDADLPDIDGNPRQPLNAAPAERIAADAIAAALLRIWTRAGTRYLNPASIKAEHQHFANLIAAKERTENRA